MVDRIIAFVALASLTAYLGIFVISVPRPALFVVAGLILAMAYFDFWNQLFRNGRK